MGNKKIKILAIDDIPDNLISIKAQIREVFPEASVFTALDGAKGIELAALEDPDVILLDIVMPGMDGYELCKLLKADQKLCSIPVVFITANKSDKESRIRALECGAEALLAKPIDPIELIAQIRAMVKVKDASIIKQKEEERLTQLVEEQVLELKLTHTASLNLLEDLRNEVEARLQYEQKLESSEEHYRILTQSANDAIVTINNSGAIIEWNNGAEKTFGYTKEEVYGKPMVGIIPQQFRQHHIDFIDRIPGDEYSGLVGHTVEMVGLHQNGTEFPIELSFSSWETASGHFFTAIIRDISERKNAEKKLYEKEMQFRKLSANLPDMIFQFTRRLDGSFCVPIASDGIKNIYGLLPEDVIDDFTPIFKLIYPEDSARLLSNIQYSAEHLTHFDIEYRVQLPGQEIKCLHCKSIPELLADGSIIWYGFIMDITLRRMVEERIKNSEEKFRAIAEQTSDLISLCDANGFITYASPSSRELFRCEPEEMCGHNFVDFLDPEDVPRVVEVFHESLEQKKKMVNLELKLKRKDKSVFFGELNGSPFSVGMEIGSLVIIRDFTERKQAEIELLKSKDQAEESDRLKSAFLANMSHEIRTPMNGILGFAELLKDPGLTGEQQQQYISIIEKSGSRMLNIINNIVDISKIEAGLMTVDIHDSDINEQIEFIATFFKPEAEKKGIELSYRIGLPTGKATIKTDREKIFAILTNLVKNAIKYTNKGSIEFGYKLVETLNASSPQNSVLLQKRTQVLEFYVYDTGIGIPKNRQEAVFKRFIQADIDDKMAQQGAGLGLAISNAYVKMLGGSMRVESEEGKGSTFYFTIPYSFKPDEKEQDQITIFMDEVLKQFKKLIILIAEDDEESQLFLEIAMKRISKKIIKAKTGLEAVEACRINKDIDLVLMDIKMPQMDGYEATRQIRQINKDVVIIAQTAYGLSDDNELALMAGCNDFISKPIKRERLLDLVQKYFEN